MALIAKTLGPVVVVAVRELADPVDAVAGDIADVAGAYAFGEQHDDLVVAASGGVFAFSVEGFEVVDAEVGFDDQLPRHD